ncbi:hypothetical protein KR018_012008 [Drosophila ironensis]|nr:hypothetical protein KR018_012008 [Drosophila ironensis]
MKMRNHKENGNSAADVSEGNAAGNLAKMEPENNNKISVVSKLLLKDSNGNGNGNGNASRNSNSNSSSNLNSNASFSSASVAGSVQVSLKDYMMPQHKILDQCGLTQAGLEEYNIRSSSYYDQTAFHHQKQASYAQSEGYHSYVSSSDSATPFLDKLRQESDLLSRQSHHWSENDLSSVCSNSVAPSPIPILATRPSHSHGPSVASSASNSNVNGNGTANSAANNNSSESTSSTETLKWLGSMSDISEASHVTGYSTIAESVSSSQLIVHSSRVLTPKRHHSESVLYLHDTEPAAPNPSGSSPEVTSSSSSSASATSSKAISEEGSGPGPVPQLRVQHRHSPSYPPVHTSMVLHHIQQDHQNLHYQSKLGPQSSLQELESPTEKPRSHLGQSHSMGDLQQQQQQHHHHQLGGRQHKSSISVTISSSEAVVTIAPQPPAGKPSKLQASAMGKADALSCSAPNVGDQSPPLASSGSSSSGSSTDSYRSNHRLFPVSTYTEPVHSNTSQYVQHPKPQFSSGLHKSNKLPVITPAGATVQPTWHSVAERINDFERSQMGEPAKFAYLEPSKTHRLSNPALKAFQKNAVQSYVERQQQQQQKQEEHQLLRNPHGQSQPYQSVQVERKSLPNNLSPIMVGLPTGLGTAQSSRDCSSPTPPPPPPRSRSLLPNILRRSSSASDYAEFREMYQAGPGKAPSIRNIGSAEKMSFNDCGMPPPPPPPRGTRGVALPTRRTSSATEYAPMRDKLLLQQAAALAHQQHHPQQHRHQPPERPPKHPNLRVPSPELPPPPMQGGELDTSYTYDEPLPPPPPPEVLQQRPPPSPNRRNSFAGAGSTRRTAYAAPAAKVPPLVPKKPTSLQVGSSGSGNHLNANSRKRPHHTPSQPILENVVAGNANVAPPPPLLPRARNNAHDHVIASNLESNQQKRSNSKASYLPRQSLEKLNNTDPDHGIYKLTLTSNEDLVAPTKPSYGVTGKLPSNLPDVLPLGVKLQQQPKAQPGSPNGDANVTLRYGSNNNLSGNSPTSATPPYYGGGQRYSTPVLGQGYGKPGVKQMHPQQYARSQSYDVKQTNLNLVNSPPPMSQSHVDLKQVARELETTLEEVLLPMPLPATPTPTATPTSPRLSPASSHSDCSLSHSSLECTINPIPMSPQAEAHIFRAEVISTTTTGTLNPSKPPMNRQESLRENIEKITQLQSQLMSTHIGGSVLLGGSFTGSGSARITSPTAAEPPMLTPPPPLPPTSPPSPPTLSDDDDAQPASPEIESLQLLQRSELVLMVNAKPSTAEMACQTDDLEDRDTDLEAAREEQQTRTTLQPRQRQPIELDYEQMSRELVQLLPAGDKLVDILTPKSCKPTSHYVSNLYNPDVPLRLAKRDVGTSTLMRMKSITGTAETRVVSVELQLGEPSGEATNLIKQKLDELIQQLNQKIGCLKREQQTISEESSANDRLGQDLFAKLAERVRPSEASKFRTHVDAVGQITSLLLSLSERLAQTESSLEARQHEKGVLEAKREHLWEQLEDAMLLKSDIDRRGSSIAGLLGKHLSADLCADYDYFINMKAKLIADARDLADRIKGSEEQLGALSDALVQSDC